MTLDGTAVDPGMHKIDLSSSAASLDSPVQYAPVSVGQTSFPTLETYTFTVPASAVSDLTLTHLYFDAHNHFEVELPDDTIIYKNTSIGSASFHNPTVDKVKGYPVTNHTVTVESSYAELSGAGKYEQGNTVTIKAGTRSDYTFGGWTTSDNVEFVDANSTTTTFTMPDNDVTVTAKWIYSGGGQHQQQQIRRSFEQCRDFRQHQH